MTQEHLSDDLPFDLYAEWEDRHAAGESVSLEQVCAAHTGLLPEVKVIARRLAGVRTLTLPACPPDEPGSVGPTGAGAEDGWVEVGHGASSVVYRGEDPDFGTTVAYKVLRPRYAGLSAGDMVRLMKRFEQEARILARLKHEGVVRIFKTFIRDGRPVIEMEYLPGRSLEDRAADVRRQGPAAIARFVERVARAVGFAHQQGIVHRDLKPSNILLDADGRPCVSDFGVAKLVRPAGLEDDPASIGGLAADEPDAHRLTVHGREPGTRAYMAPEQRHPELGGVTAAADVWALGVILYELLTDRRPEVVGSAGPIRPRRYNPRVSRRLERVVLHCLQADPSRRYPAAAALADALARCRPARTRVGPWLTATALLVATPLLAVLLAVALGARPPGWEEWLYSRKTAGATATVEAGREVRIGWTDAPPHWWRAGQGDVRWRVNDAGEGELTVSTVGPSLLELLPDPGRDAYELSLWVRQDNSNNAFAAVAAYVGHTPVTTSEGPQHGLVAVSFADLGPMAQTARDPAGRPSSCVQLGLMLHGASTDQPFRHLATSDPYCRVHYSAPAPYSPPGPWRRLTVTVGADRVSATCHWMEDTTVSLDPIARWADHVRKCIGQGHVDLDGIAPPWRPRGGLGLYVYGCKVSVKGVEVKPVVP